MNQTDPERNRSRIIGEALPRIDAPDKVTGSCRYTDDLTLPRMVYGKILRSPYPHARILSINLEAALKHPGVLAAITGADTPVKYGILPSSQDETALAREKVRYVGEPVAAVAAIDEVTAQEALDLINVRYEQLPSIMTIDDALKEDIKIHEESTKANIHKEVHLEFGSVEEGFAAADHIRDDTFFYGGSNHAAIEEHSALANFASDGKLTIWTSTQCPHYVNRELARVLGVPERRIRVIAPPLGGGFGGKSEAFSHEFCAALLSARIGRPVKITLSREEVFYTHRGRHPCRIHLKTGIKKDGTITAVHLTTWLDGGAYGSYGVATTYYTGALLTVTYKIPNLKFDGYRLFTNKPPCGPKRGHGAPQPRYAFEVQLDKIAEDLGLDPVRIRKRNLVEPDSQTINSLRITSCGLKNCIEAVLARSGFEEKRGKLGTGGGIGFAVSGYISGAALPIYWNQMPHTGVVVEVDRSGRVTVFSGTTEIGQGSDSTLAYIASEELGLDVSDVTVISGDTELTPVDLGSYSSRVTFMAGNALKEACNKLRKLIAEAACKKLQVPEERLRFGNGRVYDEKTPSSSLGFVDAVQLAEEQHGSLVAKGNYTPPKLGGNYKGAGVGPSPAYSYTAAVAQVEVDPESYHIAVKRVWVAHDCGRALNLLNVEGQIEGCAYMAVGEALFEEQAFVGGMHRTPTLIDYKTPTILDTPEIESIIIETDDPEGPYGAKEAGEGPLLPIVPAITNAVYDALGVRIDSVPITPWKILKELRSRRLDP